MQKNQSSLKIYLLTRALKRKGPITLILIILLALFALPKISSLANYIDDTSDNYLSKIHLTVLKNTLAKTKTIQTYISAYSSQAEQTDNSPCIAAKGYDLCQNNIENVVACNFLPIGTKIKIPEINSDLIFTVVDRMNEKYDNRIDIWMKSAQKAKNFGIKYLTIEIFE